MAKSAEEQLDEIRGMLIKQDDSIPKIYDLETETYRLATQEDVERMQVRLIELENFVMRLKLFVSQDQIVEVLFSSKELRSLADRLP